MEVKVFEVSKGKGRKKVIKFVEVKDKKGIETLGMFVFNGWTVRELEEII